MELLDFRDELRDIWLWLGDEDDWLLDRSQFPPAAAAEAEAAHATPDDDDGENEAAAMAAPAPACVTVTNGCTDAPTLPTILPH